jgi:nicotinamidase-related amidase
MFIINPSIIPAFRTSQALLVLDLQNDFVSPDGALPVTEPEGLVSRTLALVRAFQDSGDGHVIWVSSEFDAHRPTTGDGGQIVAVDAPPRRASTASRGRQDASCQHDEAAMEADEEAFLSGRLDTEKSACVRTNTKGVELAAEVQQALGRKDFTLKKTHYSAFATQRLLQILRANLVTELYICGALTNISIYATALDAGRYGYAITLVEDCCGYRKVTRHTTAVHQLISNAGCDAVTAEEIITARTNSNRNSNGSNNNIPLAVISHFT